jgi:hypothetical protein
MYPDDSIQFLVEPWWIPAEGAQIQRGRLISTLVAFPDMKPHRLVPEGRGDEVRQHDRALFRIEEYRIGDPQRRADVLPVAGLPLHPGESYAVHRGKVRPAIVLSTGGPEVPRPRGAARWQTAHTFLVAPLYGADAGGTRGGWHPTFVERIRHAEYPQYVWDKLPITGAAESILRLDHVFALGADSAGLHHCPFPLSPDALNVIDDWLHWLLTGDLDPESVLAMMRIACSNLPGGTGAGDVPLIVEI